MLLGKGREEEYAELLAVRKIPLTRVGYIDADLQERESDAEVVAEAQLVDAGARILMDEMRSIATTDREVADKVRSLLFKMHVRGKLTKSAL